MSAGGNRESRDGCGTNSISVAVYLLVRRYSSHLGSLKSIGSGSVRVARGLPGSAFLELKADRKPRDSEALGLLTAKEMLLR